MRRLGIVIAALAALAFGAQPIVASAAAAAPIAQKARDQGKAEAPAAITAAKLDCTMTDAYLVLNGTDPKGKKTSLYEVSCAEGMGYFIQSSGTTAQAFDCLSIDAQAAKNKDSLACRLDENADPKLGLAKLVATAGQTCTPTNARPMGATPSGDAFYEIACTGNRGFVVQTSPGKPPAAIDCLQMLGTNATECTLTTKAQIMTGMSALASKTPTPCSVGNARVVGSDKNSGDSYYEVSCTGGGGYMLQADKTGAFKQAIGCDKAQSIGGGCSLTVVDETAENGTYTKLATAAGWPCDVQHYRFLGNDPKSQSEVVELACKDHADGGIGMFPTSGAKGQVVDCVQGGAFGVACQLTPASAVYDKYTARLVAMGKGQCKVSGARFLATTQDGQDFIETACSDGLPGYVVSITHATGATKELLTCGQVTRVGAPCALPTNVAKK